MWILYWLPKNLLSYGVGRIMHLEYPRVLVQMWIRLFAALYSINLSEAEKEIEAYKSVGDFFIRRLKTGVRPMGQGSYVHPADSRLTARGLVVGDQLLQAKGRLYSLSQFLQEPSVEKWNKGYFLTYYLCPTDYHRVHSPVSGRIREVRYVPGNLWPVNDWSVSEIKDLFIKNERVIVEMETSKGPLALVFVGATNVGSIRLAFEPSLQTNHAHKREARQISYVDPLPVEKGDELGYFAMGSTVIVVAGAGWSELNALALEQKTISVKVGQSIGLSPE